jgi:hypothetical protein
VLIILDKQHLFELSFFLNFKFLIYGMFVLNVVFLIGVIVHNNKIGVMVFTTNGIRAQS